MNRGDVYWANLDPAIGSEMKDIHPVLIISNNLGNLHSSVVIIAPISSVKDFTKDLPIFVFLSKGEAGLEKDSFVHCGQIRTLDKRRLNSKLGNLAKEKMLEVNKAIFKSLALV